MNLGDKLFKEIRNGLVAILVLTISTGLFYLTVFNTFLLAGYMIENEADLVCTNSMEIYVALEYLGQGLAFLEITNSIFMAYVVCRVLYVVALILFDYYNKKHKGDKK